VNPRRTFLILCTGEIALFLVAVMWIKVAGAPALSRFDWNLRDVLIGVGAALPPFLFFLFTLRSPSFSRHRETMDMALRPVVSEWNVLQMACVSALAGICEELLFRGVLQGGLTEHIGVAPALVLSSVVFGAVHLITRTYGVLAGLIGLYLGVELIWTENLLTPIVTHAVYDFAALLFYNKVYRPEPRVAGPDVSGDSRP
jgi:uncharacterized protein